MELYSVGEITEFCISPGVLNKENMDKEIGDRTKRQTDNKVMLE